MKKDLGRLIVYVLLINSLTIFILSSFSILLIRREILLIIAEIVIAATEMCLLKLLIQIRWRKALILSIVANAASLIAGWIVSLAVNKL
jgi:hypothetical protein